MAENSSWGGWNIQDIKVFCITAQFETLVLHIRVEKEVIPLKAKTGFRDQGLSET